MSFYGLAKAEDVTLTFPDIVVPQGGMGEMVVGWNNRMENLCGFRIDFTLPEGVHLTDAQLGDALAASAPGLSVRISSGAGGKASVLGFQIPPKPLPKGEGDFLRLTFEAEISVPVGNHSVTVDRVEISDGTDTGLLADLPSFSIYVTPYDYDGQDIVTEFPEIDVVQGGKAEMSVTWSNKKDNLQAFMFDFRLPDGIHLVDARLGEDLASSNPTFEVNFNDRRESDGHTVIMGFETDGRPLPLGECELLRLTFEAEPAMPLGRHAVTTAGIEFFDGDAGENVALPPRVFRINVLPQTTGDLDVAFSFTDTDVPQGDEGEMTLAWNNNEADIRGFKLAFTLPEGIGLADVQMDEALEASHPDMQATLASEEGNHYVVTCKTKDEGPFPQGEYRLLRLVFQSDFEAPLGKRTVTTAPVEVMTRDESTFLSTQSFVLNVVPAIPYVAIDIPDVDVAPGKMGVMTVKWNNHQEKVIGFQLDFVLPDGISLVDAKASEAIETSNPDFRVRHSVSSYDNKTIVLGIQSSRKPLPRGKGDLVILTFKAEETVPMDSYSVEVSRVDFSIDAANGGKISLEPCLFNVNVKDMEPVRGDVNDDGIVDIKDVMAAVGVILGNQPEAYCAENADVDGNNEIDIYDVMFIVDIILNGK